jgi:S-adenosylmethionine hydrolase
MKPDDEMMVERAGIVTLTTDFGLADGYVGQLWGVILGIDRALTVVDITHAVPPQAVATGGFLLAAAAGAFPAGTVHVLVVDPGVGTARHGLVARVGDAWFVGPDNGGWTYLARAAEATGGTVQAWRLTAVRYWRPGVSATFHGRDVFAPVAAHLARGVAPEDLGQPLAAPLRLPLPVVSRAANRSSGRIVHIDHFGNAITDLQPSDLPGMPAGCAVHCGAFIVEWLATTYADVAIGAPVALIGSFGTVELACRDGDAAATWGLTVGAPVVVVGGGGG